jgi:hypothetical protein
MDTVFNYGDRVKATGNRGVEDRLRSDTIYTVLDYNTDGWGQTIPNSL